MSTELFAIDHGTGLEENYLEIQIPGLLNYRHFPNISLWALNWITLPDFFLTGFFRSVVNDLCLSFSMDRKNSEINLRNSVLQLVSASSISEIALSVGINPDEKLINSILPENEIDKH